MSNDTDKKVDDLVEEVVKEVMIDAALKEIGGELSAYPYTEESEGVHMDDNDEQEANLYEREHEQSGEEYQIDSEETIYYQQTFESSYQEINSEIESLTRKIEAKQVYTEVKPSENKRPVYKIGMFTASLSLVVVGVSLISALSVPGGAGTLFRWSPLILVFLGIELALNIFFQKNKMPKFDMMSVSVAAGLILMSFVLSMISVSVTDSNISRDITERRFGGEIKQELIEIISEECSLSKLDVNVSLYEPNVAHYRRINDIMITDEIKIEVQFLEIQSSVMEFAEDVKYILDVISKREYTVSYIKFSTKDAYNDIYVELDGTFPNLTASDIARKTYYYTAEFNEDIPDLIEYSDDIPDLIEYSEDD